MGICSAYECDRPSRARTLCTMHYERLRKHGDIGINYKSKMNRLMVKDISAYIPSLITSYEQTALREIFFRGKNHGGVTISHDWAIGID